MCLEPNFLAVALPTREVSCLPKTVIMFSNSGSTAQAVKPAQDSPVGSALSHLHGHHLLLPVTCPIVKSGVQGVGITENWKLDSSLGGISIPYIFWLSLLPWRAFSLSQRRVGLIALIMHGLSIDLLAPWTCHLQFLQGSSTSVISETDRSLWNGRLMDRKPITGWLKRSWWWVDSHPHAIFKCLYYTEWLDTLECLPFKHCSKMLSFPLAFTQE